MNDVTPPERSLTALLAELTRETTTLLRSEVQLARTEITDNIRRAGSGLALAAAAAVVLLVALQTLAAAAVLGLATAIDDWAAALAIGAVIAVIGIAMLIRGLTNLRRDSLTPRRTLDSLRAGTRWAKEQLP
jgi:hypothetical protein